MPVYKWSRFFLRTNGTNGPTGSTRGPRGPKNACCLLVKRQEVIQKAKDDTPMELFKTWWCLTSSLLWWEMRRRENIVDSGLWIEYLHPEQWISCKLNERYAGLFLSRKTFTRCNRENLSRNNCYLGLNAKLFLYQQCNYGLFKGISQMIEYWHSSSLSIVKCVIYSSLSIIKNMTLHHQQSNCGPFQSICQMIKYWHSSSLLHQRRQK